MTEIEKSKRYDLENRTIKYAKSVREFVKLLPKTLINMDDLKQLLRSSGSVGANYIEANEAISRKDFIHRIKICRKEAKESRYWLQLLEMDDSELIIQKDNLIDETNQLMKIFGSIIEKSK
jgi:four helix bundle protein